MLFNRANSSLSSCSTRSAVAATLGMVSKDVSGNGYAGFDGREAWIEAIYWAKAKPEFLNPPSWTERVVHVGKASSRLIQRYKIQLSAFGAYASTVTVTQICNQTISLVRFVGGACAPDTSLILVESKAVHDGFFIFGNKFSPTPGEHEPAYFVARDQRDCRMKDPIGGTSGHGAGSPKAPLIVDKNVD